MLNGHPVTTINANLTATLDVTQARRLPENFGIAFMGDTKGGPFEIPLAIALTMLNAPNPHGKSNRDVVRPWANGLDVTGRPRGMYIIDFGTEMTLEEAALYEEPFTYAERVIKTERVKSRSTTGRWWLHERTRSEMREALAPLSRYLVTPTTSKYRLFTWFSAETLPHNALIAFAREDDFFFGVLHSHVHELWALALGTQLESRPRYTPTTTFETFPLPHPNEQQTTAISTAARTLASLRQGWLNPVGLSSAELQDRTLTNLYNRRPAWLDQAHNRLDRAVFDAYGWPYPLGDQELLGRLLQLNEERAG